MYNAAKSQGPDQLYREISVDSEPDSIATQRHIRKTKTGSFRIPRRSLDTLVEHQADAWQIGTFLTIARYTDPSGKFSTAGFQAVYNGTGASPGTEKKPGAARELAESVLKIGRQYGEPVNPKKKTRKLNGLLYRPDEWTNKTGEEIPEIDHDMHKIRWVLNDFQTDDWVWFPNSLVDGYGRFKRPLKRLKRCGDIATRLLLLFYASDNMEEFGGIPPCGTVFKKYSLTHVDSRHGYTLWSAEREDNTAYTDFILSSIGLDRLSDDETLCEREKQSFWDSFESLVNQGFLYECVTVMDGEELTKNSRPIYDLTARPKHGKVLKGEEGMLPRITEIFKRLGLPAVDNQSRYNGIYPVISMVGIRPLVIGIYRLRFRITNPKNYPVSAAWLRIQEDRLEFTDSLDQLEAILKTE